MRLVKTCDACPEQYDVYKKDWKIGYLRLRYGHFTAQVIDPGGKQVYEASIGGPMTGEFTTQQERKFHLKAAKKAIKEELKRRNLI
jgi:hypothetical protein